MDTGVDFGERMFYIHMLQLKNKECAHLIQLETQVT